MFATLSVLCCFGESGLREHKGRLQATPAGQVLWANSLYLATRLPLYATLQYWNRAYHHSLR